MSFNATALKRQEKLNTRVGHSFTGVKRGQDFNVKFRRYTSNKKNDEGVPTPEKQSRFYMSDKVWADLGLDTNELQWFDYRETKESPCTAVFFVKVGAGEGDIFKKTSKNDGDNSKSKNFKSELIEKALIEAGILDDTDYSGINQHLSLESVNIEGQDYLQIVKDTTERSKEEAPKSEATSVDAPSGSNGSNQDEDDNL